MVLWESAEVEKHMLIESCPVHPMCKFGRNSPVTPHDAVALRYGGTERCHQHAVAPRHTYGNVQQSATRNTRTFSATSYPIGINWNMCLVPASIAACKRGLRIMWGRLWRCWSGLPCTLGHPHPITPGARFPAPPVPVASDPGFHLFYEGSS